MTICNTADLPDTESGAKLYLDTNTNTQGGRLILFGDHMKLTASVVGVLGYRSGGPGSIPGTTKKKVVGLERGPEELLDRKVASPV
jgi:hypothetical protein